MFASIMFGVDAGIILKNTNARILQGSAFLGVAAPPPPPSRPPDFLIAKADGPGTGGRFKSLHLQ